MKLLLAVDRQFCAFGYVLTNQAIGVLVASSLPWAVRTAIVHGHASVDCQLFVQRHCFPLIVGERLTHRLSDGAQLFCEGLQDIGGTGRRVVWQLDQHGQSAGALDQGANGTGVALALDEVNLPVAGELPVLNLGRAHMDAQDARNVATPVLPLAARGALVADLAQVGNEFLAKLAHGLRVEAVVVDFV